MKTSTQTIKYILTAITTAILTIAMTVFAAPFTPGQTLDPNCNPGDVDCYVDKVQYIQINYNDLKTLKDTGDLQPGYSYLIQDYQTIYDQPVTNITKTSAIEPLVVLATSPSTLAENAHSLVYPQDTIKYNIDIDQTAINNVDTKGRIVERIDEFNNRTDYDHRAVLFARWDDGLGNFTSTTDNGNAMQEFLTFNNLGLNNKLGNFKELIGFLNQEFPNIVFHDIAINNTIQGFSRNNTFLSFASGNTFTGDVYDNTFGNFNENQVGDQFFNNTFDPGEFVRNNVFKEFVANNTFAGGEINRNTFSGKIDNNSFTGQMTGNEFQGGFSNNVIDGGAEALAFVYSNTKIEDRTITVGLYPDLFDIVHAVTFITASNGQVFYKFYDGTQEQYVEII